jgi:hypothetical protein
MGTDIHGFLQVRELPDEPYVTVAELPDGRCYATFYALAGIRRGFDDIVPFSQPRGVPEDLEESSRGYPSAHGGGFEPDRYMLDEKGEKQWIGEHSHSWLYLTEIDMRPGIEGEWLDFISFQFREHYHLTKDDPQAVRIVFGFDS